MRTADDDANAPAPEIPVYRIRVKGRLSDRWSEWFDHLTISSREDGTTWLVGPVLDDGALHGLLKKIRDMNLPLLSVHKDETEEQE